MVNNAPIDASPRHPGTDPPSRKTVLFENSGVPRLEACGAQEDFTAGFQSAVESSHLGEGVGVLGVEPVHAVHDLDCSCQKGDGRAVGIPRGSAYDGMT